MNRIFLASVMALAPVTALAGGLVVENAYVLLAPPGVKVHAAYMTLRNQGMVPRSLIGVSAEGYKMAHIHKSTETDGVMSMTIVHQLEIAPGSSVEFKPGGFHVMLMKPQKAAELGQKVPLKLEFANGEVLEVSATIAKRTGGS